MEPLESAPLLLSEEMTSCTSDLSEAQRDATPENCFLAERMLPPLDENLERGIGCDNTSPKMVDDDVTTLKQLAPQAAAADSRQGPQGGHTQHRDHIRPAEGASGCSTSGQDWLETARLAAYPPPPNPQPLPPGKSFHVFFSYCWRDAAWVRRMVEVLEREHGLRCCYHERDFKPGARVIENINLHIERSVKTALVVTPAFLESEWCSYEAEVVMHLSVDQRRRLLVPVLLQQCQLPGALRPLTYIDATMPTFLDRFLAAILDQDEFVHERPLPLRRTDFFFNPNFYNLDYLCDITSKWTCLRGEIFPSAYLPEVLMNRGLTMTEKEQEEVVARLTTASSIRCSGMCDHCCLFFLCLFCCIFIFMDAFVQGLTFLAASKSATDFFKGWSLVIVSVALLWFVIIPLIAVGPIKKGRLRKAMVEVNRIYLRHQLIAGLVTSEGICRQSTLRLKVYYFDPRSCLDHLASLLSSGHSPSIQGAEGRDKQLLDADRSTQVTEGERSACGGGQGSASEQTGGDDTELLIPDEDVEGPEEDHLAHCPSSSTQLLDGDRSTQITEGERSASQGGQGSASEQTGGADVVLQIPAEDVEGPEEVRETSSTENQALELLLHFSVYYMEDYINRNLPPCERPRHVRQVPCLCQYVEEGIAAVRSALEQHVRT